SPLLLELAAREVCERGVSAVLASVEAGVALAPLDAALGRSFALLDEEHRAALATLGAFHGSFDLGQAEAVIAPSAPERVPRLLQGLRDASLLQTEEPAELRGEVRYSLSRSARAFARRALDDAAEREAVLERYAASVTA